MPYTNFGAPGLGDSCKYIAQTSVHYITQFMLPELQYHDPACQAWSLHNHWICSHGHFTVVVHVIIYIFWFLFYCLQLIVLTPSMASMYVYVQSWLYYRLFVFISTWYFLKDFIPMSQAYGPSLPDSSGVCYQLHLNFPLKFHLFDYSSMQPINVVNIYCSFSVVRITLDLKRPSCRE